MSNKVRRFFSKAVNLITSATAQGLSKGELGSPDTPEEMKSIARIAAEEGIVMLKNNGVLPIEKDENVCIFGRIQRDYFFVGYGSGGDVNKPYCVDLVDGMKNAGIKVDEQIEKIYSDWIKKNPADDGFWGAWPRYHDEMKIDEKTVADAAKRSSCAVVVIGRSAGEDRENTLKKGSYYLTDDETALLDKVTANFKNTVVLINSGNIIDMSWMNKYGDKLGAVLYVWQGGMESGNAIGEVLSGKASPSGKLPDTIADCYESYPAAENFGERTYNNYAEDIFVGYRYFETFAPEKVMFPFGFGLSYTSFELSDKTVMEADDRIIVSVKVRNVGSAAGKEVVEVYYGAPQGELGKAAKSLAAYEKTRTLLPGEEQRVVVSFPCANMASFDDSGKSGAAFCYVLEAGDYPIYAGTDVRSCEQIGVHTEPELRVTERLASRADCAPKEAFDRLVAATDEQGKIEKAYESVPLSTVSRREEIEKNLPEAPDFTGDKGIKLEDVANNRATLAGFTAQLEDVELEALCRGDYVMNSKLGTPGNAAVYGGILKSLRKKGVPPVSATDGPSGIRLHCYASLLPIGTLLASTWNQQLVRELYAVEGAEMARKGSDVLLAPGMNIHRDPLCGRNFEYYSECGVLSGLTAAAEVSGATENGLICYVKHFAFNDQDNYRQNNICTWLNEQSAREIYLKAFEQPIKAGGMGVMTSMNAVGPVWAGGCKALLTNILRDEWGFHGAVITDAVVSAWYMDGNLAIRTGGTKMLAFNITNEFYRDLNSVGTVTAMRNAAHGTLYALANSFAVTRAVSVPKWVKTTYAVDAVVAIILVAWEICAIRKYRKAKKEDEDTEQ